LEDQLAKDLIRRADKMKSTRGVWESHWQEIRDYLMPLVASFTGIETPGVKRGQEILDSHGETASEIFAAGIYGLVMNPGTKWFGLRPRRRALRNSFLSTTWLSQAMDVMYDVFDATESGFKTAAPGVFRGIGDFGIAGFYIQDRPGRLPLYQERPLRELFIAESAEGRVDTVFRRFMLSARQALQKWGDAAGAKVIKAANGKNPDQEFEFLHAVFPRREHTQGLSDAKRMPIASVWVNVSEKLTMKVSGYREMPFLVPRWHVASNEVYGRGPGTRALFDVKSLQRTMQITFEGAEKQIDPPLMVADDGVIGDVTLRRGELNHVRSELMTGRAEAIKPLLTQGRPDLGEDLAEGIRQRIEQRYYNHLLQLSRDPRMTATQVIKLDAETLRVLGPFVGRVQDELVGPVVERSFMILLRAGFFPPMPEELAGESIEVHYTSPIARAQSLSEISAFGEFNDVTAPLVARNPELLDNLDEDRAYRITADRLGLPAEFMRDPKKVEARRKARQEEQQRQLQAEEVERGASAAQSAGQALAAVQGAGLVPAAGTGGGS